MNRFAASPLFEFTSGLLYFFSFLLLSPFLSGCVFRHLLLYCFYIACVFLVWSMRAMRPRCDRDLVCWHVPKEGTAGLARGTRQSKPSDVAICSPMQFSFDDAENIADMMENRDDSLRYSGVTSAGESQYVFTKRVNSMSTVSTADNSSIVDIARISSTVCC
jgi:hypothetical protein